MCGVPDPPQMGELCVRTTSNIFSSYSVLFTTYLGIIMFFLEYAYLQQMNKMTGVGAGD